MSEGVVNASIRSKDKQDSGRQVAGSKFLSNARCVPRLCRSEVIGKFPVHHDAGKAASVGVPLWVFLGYR